MTTASGFWFYGRLSPAAAARFRLAEFPVAEGVLLDVEHDGFAIWTRPGSPSVSSFADAVTLARETILLTVAAYAVITGMALDWALGGWIEATNAEFDGSVVGFTVDPRGRLPIDDEGSADLKKAASLAITAEAAPSWRLAIRDVYAALQERGDDAFVFSYRAIEDVVRAASGATGDLSASDWRSLHNHLDTTEQAFRKRIGALQAAREAAAHGDAADVHLIEARLNHDQTVGIGRSVVAEAIAKATSLPLTAGDFQLDELGYRRA